MTRKALCLLLAVVFVVGLLPVSALADEWFLEDGNISVSTNINEAGDSTQTVTQGANKKEDWSPVITQKDNTVATNSTITLSGGEVGGTETDRVTMPVQVTIKDVNMEAPKGESAIIVTGGSVGMIQVAGNNTITASGDNAAISTNGAIVDITGALNSSPDKIEVIGGNITVNAENGAAIGGNAGEAMSGEITLGDGLNATLKSENSAPVGYGKDGSDDGLEVGVDVGAVVNDKTYNIGDELGSDLTNAEVTFTTKTTYGVEVEGNAPVFKGFTGALAVPKNFKTLGGDGKPCYFERKLEEETLTIKLYTKSGTLLVKSADIQALKDEGVESLHFETKTGEVTISIADLLAVCKDGTTLEIKITAGVVEVTIIEKDGTRTPFTVK